MHNTANYRTKQVFITRNAIRPKVGGRVRPASYKYILSTMSRS
jgi:hypothetical protein